MKTLKKPQSKTRDTILIVLQLIITLFLVTCTKNDDTSQIDIKNKLDNVLSDDKIMTPGPDPIFIDYSDESQNYKLGNPLAIDNSWSRYMYIDKTDTIYRNTASIQRLGGYLKKYGFSGVYFYSTSGIVSSTSNYPTFSTFMKTLNDNGVIYRGVASGSATTFRSSGNITKYNQSQSDVSKKINRSNLELEWWNGVTTWSNWNSVNQSVSTGTIPDNDFYEGWYKNLGSTIDTIAARDQVIYSDRILLHCYQNGYPTYSYANARSTGATGGRLDIIAKGARLANKKIDLFIIISAEKKSWGASNDFSGQVLQNAYLSGQPNPFLYVETQAYNSIFNNMTAFQKEWINFKGFVWFTKRYCYYAVPPM